MRLLLTLLALLPAACAVAERPAGGDIDGIRELEEFDPDLTELETDRLDPNGCEFVNPEDLWKLPWEEQAAAAYCRYRDDAQAGAPCRYGEFKCLPGPGKGNTDVLICNPHTLQFRWGTCSADRLAVDECPIERVVGGECRADLGCGIVDTDGKWRRGGAFVDPMDRIFCRGLSQHELEPDVRCDASGTTCGLPIDLIGRPCSPVGQSLCSPSVGSGRRDDPPGTSQAWADIRAMGGRGLEVRCDPSGVWVFGAVCGEASDPAASGAEPWPCAQTGPMQYTCKVSTNLPNPIDLANERAAEAEAEPGADADVDRM